MDTDVDMDIEFFRISVTELNGRADYQLEYMVGSKSVGTASPETLSRAGVSYSTSPYNLRLKMSGTGLYHFRSSVPRYMSYCHLQTEFVVRSFSRISDETLKDFCFTLFPFFIFCHMESLLTLWNPLAWGPRATIFCK